MIEILSKPKSRKEGYEEWFDAWFKDDQNNLILFWQAMSLDKTILSVQLLPRIKERFPIRTSNRFIAVSVTEGSRSSPETRLEYHCPNWFESELSFTSLDSPSRQHTQSVVCTLSNHAGCPMAVLQHWHSHTNSQYNLKVTFFPNHVLISLIIIMRYLSIGLTQFSNSDWFWVIITVGKI